MGRRDSGQLCQIRYKMGLFLFVLFYYKFFMFVSTHRTDLKNSRFDTFWRQFVTIKGLIFNYDLPVSARNVGVLDWLSLVRRDIDW